MPTLAAILFASFCFEWRKRIASPIELIYPLMFALLVVLMFGLALGGGAAQMRPTSPALLLIIVLLASLLSLNSLFKGDLEDGSLDQLCLSRAPLSVTLLGKALAHWLSCGLMLSLSSPLLLLLLRAPLDHLPLTIFVLSLTTLAITMLGLCTSALTVRLPQGGMLLLLLVMPLYLPILIFAVGTLMAVNAGESPRGALAALAAITLLSAALAPLAAALALRLTSD
jgi:heme exporter protein B